MSVSVWKKCESVGPGGEKCGEGHVSPHTWEECQAKSKDGDKCYGVDPVPGQNGFPKASSAGHAGKHSWE